VSARASVRENSAAAKGRRGGDQADRKRDGAIEGVRKERNTAQGDSYG
jgi:hypothetical protein